MSKFKVGDRVQVVPSPCVDDPHLEGVTGVVVDAPIETLLVLLAIRAGMPAKPGHEDVVVETDEGMSLVLCSTAVRKIAPSTEWSAICDQLGYKPITP